MRKGAVPRCPTTGLPLTRKAKNSLCKLPEELLNDDGTFKASAFPDCNIFNPQSLAAAADYDDVRYFMTHILPDPRSPFHAHPIKTEQGRVVSYATHTNSAQWGGKAFRAQSLAKQTGWNRDAKAMDVKWGGDNS